MKIATLITMLMFALPTFANRTEMQTLILLTDGEIYEGHVPAGYAFAKITNLRTLGQLRSLLERTTRTKLRQ